MIRKDKRFRAEEMGSVAAPTSRLTIDFCRLGDRDNVPALYPLWVYVVGGFGFVDHELGRDGV